MSVEIKGQYEGDLRVKLTHGPSGSVIETDAPLDNQGKGARFSPTDMVVAALGSCMMTIMGIVAKRDGIKLDGAYFRVEKHMVENPRRIGKIVLEIHMPKGLTDDQKKKLEKFAHTCPVHQALHPDIEQNIKFIYP
ncbi:MAG: OsmC family protein [Candidatus Melainabacteria bacterium]|nr:OsmC family protein [Candidatus Melainabacteria bacterium]